MEGRRIERTEALDYLIRGCAVSELSRGISDIIRCAYGLGVTGQGDDGDAFETYVRGRIRVNPKAAGALFRIVSLRNAAYSLGLRDGEVFCEQ